MPDAFQKVVDSPIVRVAFSAFLIGVAWANLHAEITLGNLQRDAEIAVVRSEVHVIKVVVCRATPHDSMCAATP